MYGSILRKSRFYFFQAQSRPPVLGIDRTLNLAREAIRNGDLPAAEEALIRLAPVASHEPAFYNLLGIVQERRGLWIAARKAFGRAVAADSKYPPAQHNMRRMYELMTFGRSPKSPALGDD